MGHVACMAQKRDTFKLLLIRPEPKGLIEKLSEHCENYIKKGFRRLSSRTF
jgi:hypothetical protein